MLHGASLVHSSSVWDRKVLFEPALGQQSALPPAVCAHHILCASPVYSHEYYFPFLLSLNLFFFHFSVIFVELCEGYLNLCSQERR